MRLLSIGVMVTCSKPNHVLSPKLWFVCTSRAIMMSDDGSVSARLFEQEVNEGTYSQYGFRTCRLRRIQVLISLAIEVVRLLRAPYHQK